MKTTDGDAKKTKQLDGSWKIDFSGEKSLLFLPSVLLVVWSKGGGYP